MSAKILLVDSDTRFRALLAGILRTQDHRVIEATTGDEGRRLLLQERPDLVIVDSLLPGGGGLDWIRALRNSGDETGVILLSSPSADPLSSRHLALELKVITVVYRPIDPARFAGMVEAELVRLSAAAETSKLQGMDPEFEFGQALEELRDRYRKELPERLDELAAILEGLYEEPKSVERIRQGRDLAHRLRGTSSSYGFLVVGGEAGRIEGVLIAALEGGEFKEAHGRVAKEALAASRAGITAAPQRVNSSPYNALAKLLVVDDDLNFLALVQEMGRSLLVDVIGASTAVEAVSVAQSVELDAAIIDAHLTGGDDAFELGRFLRALPNNEDMPFAIISVDLGVENRVNAAHSGASLFLSKPLSSQQFDAAVRQLLGQRRSELPRVLVVDDDPDFTAQVVQILEDKRLSVSALHDVPSMLEALAERPPDMLLLDMDLPGMSGIDACRLVRMTPDWQDIPILFVTAHSSMEARLEAFEAGADDYLVKPLIPHEIRTRVRIRLERNRLLRERSDRDPLTGLLTRRAIFEILPARCTEASRHGRPISLALIDLDYFKNVNDEHGHLVGDRVLMRLGRLLSARFRAEDLRSRWGGEEFLLAFPGEAPQTIRSVLERVLAEFGQMPFFGEDGQSFTCSFSVGVAGAPGDGSSSEALLQVADRRLYEAKRVGRGTVIASDE